MRPNQNRKIKPFFDKATEEIQGKINFGHFSEDQTEVFYKRLKEIEGKVKNAFIATGAENADELFESAINMGEILRAIPKAQRDYILKEYDELIDFRSAIIEGTKSDYITSRDIPGSDRSVGKINVDLDVDPQTQRLNPKSVIYNRMTLNQNYRTKEWQHGTNIIKSNHLEQITKGLPDIKANANILVFDTETASLGIGNVREIAAFKVKSELVDDGRLVIGSPTKKVFHEHLKTSPMRLGSIVGDDGIAKTLGEVIKDQIGFTFYDGPEGSGEAFAKVTSDFLDEIMDSDFIVGQNIQFDIGQLFQGAKKTSIYATDGKFRNKVKAAESHIQGKIVDTLEIARMQLPDVPLSKEVKFGGAVSTHSLENLLYETNLAERIMEDMNGPGGKGGREAFYELLGARSGMGTVHAADVDARIESYLFKYLAEDSKIANPAERKLKVQRLTDPKVRTSLYRSYAPTPLTNIANIGHLDNQVQERLFNIDNGIRIMREDGSSAQAREYFDGDIEKMRSTLMGDSPPAAAFKINPIEQQAILQRRLDVPLTKVGDVQKSAYTGNSFANFAGADTKNRGFLNAGGELYQKGVLPSMEEYAAFQNQAIEAGDPLARLSLPERMVTEGMHRATAMNEEVMGSIPAAEKKAASLMGNLGTSYFELTDAPYIARSGPVSLPLDILRMAEEAGSLSGTNIGAKSGKPLEMVSASIFSYAKDNRPGANLMMDLSEGDIKGLISFMRETNKDDATIALLPEDKQKAAKELRDRLAKNMDGRNVDVIASALDDSLREGRTTVTIGQLTGKAAEAAHRVMAPFSNSGQIMNDLTEMTFKAPLLSDDGKVARVGAFVADRLMDEKELAAFGDMSLAAFKTQGQVQELAEQGALVGAEMSDRMRQKAGAAGAQFAEKMSVRAANVAEFTQKVSKKLPLLGLGIAAAFVAKKGYSEYKERSLLNETFDFQGYEPAADYYSLQQQIETRGSSRYVDPLSTAGVVGNLYNMQQNHSSMGPNKDQHLFAGVI